MLRKICRLPAIVFSGALIIFLAMETQAYGQLMLTGAGNNSASASFPATSVGNTCGSTVSTTPRTCTLTPSAGSAIWCDSSYPNGSTAVTVTDNQNTGNYVTGSTLYLNDQWPTRDPNHNQVLRSDHMVNAVNASTTVTLAWTGAGNGFLACKEIKNVPTQHVVDGNMTASQNVTTNTAPNSGSSLTPNANGSTVVAYTWLGSGSVTAGTNFALNNNAGTNFPEYWSQGTATATTAPFTGTNSSGWRSTMNAIGQKNSGTCSADGFVDWHGGINGSNPTTSDSIVYGLTNQPNTDDSLSPGIHLAGTIAGSITYDTASYIPYNATETCPSYTGSGTEGNQVGLAHTANTSSTNVDFVFLNNLPVVWATCTMSSNVLTGGQTADMCGIQDDSAVFTFDYIITHFDAAAVTTEFKSSTTITTPAVTRTSGECIGVKYRYQSGGRTLSSTGSMGATSTTLSDSGASFTAADVKRWVSVPGAGAAGGALSTFIVSLTDSSHVVVNDASTGAVTNVSVPIGVNISKIYTFASASCQGTPTLQAIQVSTALISTNGPGVEVGGFLGGSYTYTTGTSRVGAIKWSLGDNEPNF